MIPTTKTLRILFPTDFSAMSVMAYKQCLQIANQYNAEVHVLHVYRSDLTLPMPEPKAVSLMDQRKRHLRQKLAKFAHLAADKINQVLVFDLDIKTHLMSGLAEDEIAHFAKHKNIDLIIMPTKGEHNLIEVLFGSVTTATIGKATCPMLVLPENQTIGTIKNIAYATDLSIDNLERTTIPLQMAEEHDANLHYVNIVEEYPRAPQPVYEQTEKYAYHVVRESKVERGLNQFIEKNAIDLLMIFSPPKNFLQRLFKRSTTRHLVEHAQIPMLILR